MRSKTLKAILAHAGLASTLLLLSTGAAFAQQVSLTAQSTGTLLPDGQTVPMWGYACSAPAVAPATCAAANPIAGANINVLTNWSPVVITTTPGSTLTIHLTNSLPAAVPETSLVIVGQLGGGLGNVAQRTTAASPAHATQSATWPIVGDTTGPQFTPPGQSARLQSASEPVGPALTVDLTWANRKSGTYLIESGTHPSIQGAMGLYGVLVVTDPVGLQAYPAVAPTGTSLGNTAVTYNADIPLVLTQIDPVQNAALAPPLTPPGFTETTAWSRPPHGCR